MHGNNRESFLGLKLAGRERQGEMLQVRLNQQAETKGL